MGSVGGDSLEDLAMKLLEPDSITPRIITYHVKRAKRLRIYWSLLDSMERALLEAAIAAKVNTYRGRRIKSLLARLIAKIELHTMKGRVLLTGLQGALSKLHTVSHGGFSRLLSWAREKLNYILYLGRSMLVVELYFSPLRGIV